MQRRGQQAGAEAGDAALGAEEDDLGVAAEEVREADPAAEVGQVGAAGHADVLTVIDLLAGHRVGERAGAAAEPGPALDQGQAEPAVDQRRGRGQPGEAAADDDDVRGGRLVGRSVTHRTRR